MKTDRWMKDLELRLPQVLLRLIGDPQGAAVSAQVLELTSTERRVDCVIEVRHESTTHYRHIEFQAEAKARCNPGVQATLAAFAPSRQYLEALDREFTRRQKLAEEQRAKAKATTPDVAAGP